MVFLFFGAVAFKDLLKPTVFNRFFLTFVILSFLIFFVGFRYQSDNDFAVYVALYEAVPVFPNIGAIFAMTFSHGQETGYLLVKSILKALGFGPQSIFVFSTILMTFFLYKAFNKLAYYPIIALFIFFAQYFTLMFVQMRFGVATAISLYACSILPNGQKRKFWLLFVLALSFHLSTLGIIATYFLYKINWLNKNNIYRLFIIVIAAIFISIRPIFEIALSIIGIARFEYYLTGDGAEIRSLAFLFIFILPFIIFRKNLAEKGVNVNLILSMSFASILVGALVWQVGILNRFSIINASAICVAISSYLLLLKSNSTKVIAYCLLILYCFLRFLPSMQWVTEYRMFFVSI